MGAKFKIHALPTLVSLLNILASKPPHEQIKQARNNMRYVDANFILLSFERLRTNAKNLNSRNIFK